MGAKKTPTAAQGANCPAFCTQRGGGGTTAEEDDICREVAVEDGKEGTVCHKIHRVSLIEII
jgi:hypothetical protein